ncbi:hypothetical protein Ctob_016430, partial [Chrysochromulina tobinii]
MVEQLQRPACVGYPRGIVRGTIYAFRGGAGFGLYDKWGDEPRGLCFVAKFEYSHNNPNPGTKFGSFDKARTAAIHSLLSACSGEERASVQAVLDSNQREAAAAVARAKMEHDEADAKRRALAEARAAEHRMAVEAMERQRLADEAQRLAIEEAQMAAAAKQRDEAAAAEEEREWRQAFRANTPSPAADPRLDDSKRALIALNPQTTPRPLTAADVADEPGKAPLRATARDIEKAARGLRDICASGTLPMDNRVIKAMLRHGALQSTTTWVNAVLSDTAHPIFHSVLAGATRAGLLQK